MKTILPWTAAVALALLAGCGTTRWNGVGSREKFENQKFASDQRKDSPRGRPQDAQTARQADPDNAGDPIADTLQKGKFAEDSGDLRTAKARYEEVLNRDPQNAQAHHRLAVIADKQGEFARAEQHYLVALRGLPDDAELHNDLGYSYYQQGKLPEGERELHRALELQPGFKLAQSNLGYLYANRAKQTGNAADRQLAFETFRQFMGDSEAQEALNQIIPAGAGTLAGSAAPNPFAGANGAAAGMANSTGATGAGISAPLPGAAGANPASRHEAAYNDLTRRASNDLSPERIRQGLADIDNPAASRNPIPVIPPGQPVVIGPPAGGGPNIVTARAPYPPANAAPQYPQQPPAYSGAVAPAAAGTPGYPAAQTGTGSPGNGGGFDDLPPPGQPIAGQSWPPATGWENDPTVSTQVQPANLATGEDWTHNGVTSAPTGSGGWDDPRQAAARIGLNAGPGQPFPLTDASGAPMRMDARGMAQPVQGTPTISPSAMMRTVTAPNTGEQFAPASYGAPPPAAGTAAYPPATLAQPNQPMNPSNGQLLPGGARLYMPRNMPPAAPSVDPRGMGQQFAPAPALNPAANPAAAQGTASDGSRPQTMPTTGYEYGPVDPRTGAPMSPSGGGAFTTQPGVR